MLRASIIIFCLGLIACAAKQPRDKERADLHLRNGTSLLRNGQYPQALAELLRAVEFDPDNYLAHNNLALAYLVREKFDLAEQHLRKALALQPKFTEARNNLGRVLIDKHLYDEAIKELTVATQDLVYENPEKPFINLGLAHFKKGEFNKSKIAFNSALKYKKNDCAALNMYGRSLFELKSFGLAAESFDLAINSCGNVKSDEPHYYAGLSYLKTGNKEKAMSRFEEVIKLYPNGEHAKQAKTLLKVVK